MLQFLVVSLFVRDRNSVRSRGRLALNNGSALQCCLVVLREDRVVVEMVVKKGA